jgi:RNA polymerase sigma factor (TIGR02999 family)
MSEVTRVLQTIRNGEPAAAGLLLPLVYEELRRLAAQRLARETPGMTLQPTALVHEAYLRLVGGDNQCQDWDSRGHFFGAAAEAMRRILVERARHKRSLKAGGGLVRHALTEEQFVEEPPDEEMLALDEALNKLAAVDAKKAELVKLRYFGGLTMDEAARALGFSLATAERSWAYARAWLHRQIVADNQGDARRPG